MACVNHPDVPEVTRCEQCRRRVCPDCFVTLEGRPLCGNCKDRVVRQVERGETVSSLGRGPSPWERERSFATLVETLRAALFSPTAFFRGLSHDGQGHLPYLLAVAWPSTVVGTGTLYLLPLVFARTGRTEALFTALMMLGCLVVMVPVQLVMQVYIGGAIAHLCLRICGAANARMNATMRAIAFAQSGNVFAFVPILGTVVGALWVMVVQAIGLKEMHESTYGRVIAALLLPLLVCGGFVAFMFLALRAATLAR